MSEASWQGYGSWSTQGFVSYQPVAMNGWVFQVSSLHVHVMVFAINYYTEETLLVGFEDMEEAKAWIDWTFED